MTQGAKASKTQRYIRREGTEARNARAREVRNLASIVDIWLGLEMHKNIISVLDRRTYV